MSGVLFLDAIINFVRPYFRNEKERMENYIIYVVFTPFLFLLL